MTKSSPYEYLKKFVSIDKSVGLFPVIILDNAIDILDRILPVSPGHNVFPNDHFLLRCKRPVRRYWSPKARFRLVT